MWRMGEMRSGERRRDVVVPDERYQCRKVFAELGQQPLRDHCFAGLVFCRTAAEARVGPTSKDFCARYHSNFGSVLEHRCSIMVRIFERWQGDEHIGRDGFVEWIIPKRCARIPGFVESVVADRGTLRLDVAFEPQVHTDVRESGFERQDLLRPLRAALRRR